MKITMLSASGNFRRIDSSPTNRSVNPGRRRASAFALLLPVAGSVATGLFYCLNIRWDIKGLSIRPSHVIILLLWLIMIEVLVDGKLGKLFPLLIGMNSGIIIGYMLNRGHFSGQISSLWLFLLGGLIGSILIIPGILHRRESCHGSPRELLTRPLFWSITAIALVVAFRLMNVITRHDILNDQRSLMIAGTEVHHLITGFFFAAVILIILFNQSPLNRTRSLLAGFLMICIALIADQLSYILIVPLTDEAFFSVFSVVGAIAAGAWLIVRVNYKKSGHTSENDH